MTKSKKPENLRQTILNTAQVLFAERGYAATSIADIAQVAKTSKAAVFYHFPSKEDLLEALLNPLIEGLARLVQRATDEGMPPEKLLELYIDGALRSGWLTNVASDLSAQEYLTQHRVTEYCEQIVRHLAGSSASPIALLRAQAAFTIVQNAGDIRRKSGQAISERKLRTELLRAALQILQKDAQTARPDSN